MIICPPPVDRQEELLGLKNIRVIRPHEVKHPLTEQAEKLARKAMQVHDRCPICNRRIDSFLRRLLHRFTCDAWR